MRKTAIVLAMILALLAPGAAGAQPGHVSDVTMLTGPTPLTDADFEPGGCGWDPYWSEIGPTTDSSLSLEEDYESTLAVDPTDPRKMTAVWLQDDGQLVGSATSLDGGATWEYEIVPDVTACSGETIHQTSYDTRVAIGPSSEGIGRAYVLSTSQHKNGADPRAVVTHIGVSTKTFDGSRWTKPVVIDRSGLIDYPMIAVDPVRPDTAYAMWSKRIDVTFFSATYDGGKTWSTPAVVRVTTPGYLGLNELIVLRDGRIANMYIEVTPADLITATVGLLPNTVPNNVYLSLSDDQGVTWSDPERIAQTYGFGSAISVVEGDRTLFATWTTAAPDGWTTIVARRGEDGWEELASFDRGASPAVDIAVGPDGALGLTRYEARGESSQSLGKTETYAVVAHSHDGGATWESSDLGGPFDLSSTDDFVGDHGSLEATACGFASTFTLGRGLALYGPSDIFAATVHLPTAPQGTCNRARPPR